MNPEIKIVLVDDHPFILKSIKQNLSMFEGINVIYTANNGHDLLNKLQTQNTPDVIIMDLDMPIMNGILATTEIKKKYSENIKILVLTVFDNDDKILDAIKAGANGYILKEEKPEKIIAAIHEVLEGGAPMSPGIAFKTLNMLKNSSSTNNKRYEESLSSDFSLTQREIEIIQYIIDGNTYKEIASKIFISDKTVSKHIENIYKKLHVNSKMEVMKLIQKYSQQ